jgi:hypothetical protein
MDDENELNHWWVNEPTCRGEEQDHLEVSGGGARSVVLLVGGARPL